MVLDHEKDYVSRLAAVVSIAAKIGCTAQTLHEWVKKAEVDSGRRAGVPTDVVAQLKALECENENCGRLTRFCATHFNCVAFLSAGVTIGGAIRGHEQQGRDAVTLDKIASVGISVRPLWGAGISTHTRVCGGSVRQAVIWIALKSDAFVLGEITIWSAIAPLSLIGSARYRSVLDVRLIFNSTMRRASLILMYSRRTFKLGSNPSAAFVLLTILLAVIWLSGGASRADVIGQTIVRATAWAGVIFAAVCAARADLRNCMPVALLVLGFVTLPVLQLIPVPHSTWENLPNRDLFISGLAQSDHVWRPLSISPGATLNALFSLIVPATVLTLASCLNHAERTWLVTLVMLIVVASVFVGLLQFSGSEINSPVINYMSGSVSGTFANRNHFAVLLAAGCLISPVWAFVDRDQAYWRGPIAIGIVLLAALTILASGSRAGMVVGVLALIIGPLTVREELSSLFRFKQRSTLPMTIAAIIIFVFLILIFSIMAGRATSIERFAVLDIGDDMRSIGLGSVLDIIRANFPFGAGVGTFDASFRIAEPSGILQIQYFNHAHNDWLELLLETGMFGLVLMAAALSWWIKASLCVWRRSKTGLTEQSLGRLGSAIILLVLLASVVDYPARTPLFMAIVVISACWLAWGERSVRDRASLPRDISSL